jgi:hypothetical protein
MTYAGTMVLPRNAVRMTEDEMTYTDGGISIPIHQMFLNKGYCFTYAQIIVAHYPSIGLGQTRIAAELFAHALAYYNFNQTKGIVGSIAGTIRSHANPIDIGGDSGPMVIAFYAIWSAF